MSRFSGLLPRYSKSPLTVKRKGSGSKGSGSDGEEEMSPAFSHRGTGVEAFTGTSNQETQVISIAFRIWLIRNVDLVKATFECKFRVFLEWLDEAAVGLEKGEKAKELKVPSLAITNAVQAEVLDRSSAPEVVNPATGHVAVQMLFRATLRMDQQVRHFPFDCQWLAVTVSLKEEGCAQNRSFVFQYCEVDEGLSLDEWYLCPDPAFSTLTKQDAPSIQDTVMCGLLIRRASRYYVVNIMLMLGLISSIAFAIYTVNVSLFWERAEVFLGIFPLIVIFKMSAQGKLPRVGYSTKFDRFATACQTLFLVIVMGCMAASFIPNVPTWFRPCNSEGPVDQHVAGMDRVVYLASAASATFGPRGEHAKPRAGEIAGSSACTSRLLRGQCRGLGAESFHCGARREKTYQETKSTCGPGDCGGQREALKVGSWRHSNLKSY